MIKLAICAIMISDGFLDPFSRVPSYYKMRLKQKGLEIELSEIKELLTQIEEEQYKEVDIIQEIPEDFEMRNV